MSCAVGKEVRAPVAVLARPFPGLDRAGRTDPGDAATALLLAKQRGNGDRGRRAGSEAERVGHGRQAFCSVWGQRKCALAREPDTGQAQRLEHYLIVSGAHGGLPRASATLSNWKDGAEACPSGHPITGTVSAAKDKAGPAKGVGKIKLGPKPISFQKKQTTSLELCQALFCPFHKY